MHVLCGFLMTVLAAVLGAAAPATAHEMQPAVVNLSVAADGQIDVSARINLEGFLAEIGPEHADSDDAPTAMVYDGLRELEPEALQAEVGAMPAFVDAIRLTVDGAPVDLAFKGVEIPEVGDIDAARRTTVSLSGAAPGGRSLVWTSGPRVGDVVLRVTRAGEPQPFYAALVTAGDASEAVPLSLAAEQSTLDVLRVYVVSGFDHIVPKGLDHILFVIGLFLLSARWRPLLMQVTSFTFAHTITLALGATGTVSISPDIVEPLIALSIAVVALENLFTDRLGPWRPFVIFGFGLLHGLGFAGVLADFGLPEGQFLPALVAFNVGVEAGQLAVIAACYLAVGLWFSTRGWYRRAIVYPASIAIAAVALVWTVERVGIV